MTIAERAEALRKALFVEHAERPAIETIADHIGRAVVESHTQTSTITDRLTRTREWPIHLPITDREALGPEATERLTRVIRALEEDVADSDAVRERLAALLDGVAIALKGPHPPMGRHGWHDLPELATKAMQSIAMSVGDELRAKDPHAWAHEQWTLCPRCSGPTTSLCKKCRREVSEPRRCDARSDLNGRQCARSAEHDGQHASEGCSWSDDHNLPISPADDSLDTHKEKP